MAKNQVNKKKLLTVIVVILLIIAGIAIAGVVQYSTSLNSPATLPIDI